ncbi:MAG: aconitase X swivel domain-containing protein [Planctomycetota bacterium]|jgi:predicted aconitase with swiveling domain
MAKKTFRGRVVLPGKVTGKATLSKQPFNTSGSYQENMFAGRTDSAPCTDSSNKALYGKDLSDAILCTPTTVGSTMGGMCLMGMKSIGVGPRALLFSKPIDTLAAAGVLMADIWKNQRIVTVDMLGDKFLDTVKTGDPITIHEDGRVEVG